MVPFVAIADRRTERDVAEDTSLTFPLPFPLPFPLLLPLLLVARTWDALDCGDGVVRLRFVAGVLELGGGVWPMDAATRRTWSNMGSETVLGPAPAPTPAPALEWLIDWPVV